MTTDGHRRLEELFTLAVQLPIEERPAFCDRHCGGDVPLQTKLMTLLEQDDFGTRDSLRRRDAASGNAVATRVDRYRIVEKIGEGGMGVVYRAEQEHPVRRMVALKIVRAGLDTGRILERFTFERQALARMEHPGIARLFDAGSTESGRPYFAMELVDGKPITTYCEERCCSIRERLELFATACDAIQHAHHKGVVHRDIKPMNVLVVDRDESSEVKIIDFGIARDIAADDAGRRDCTEAGEVVGTYWYMSPEQADPDGHGIDSRSDVYALGVLLYELLAGVLPFSPERLRKLPLGEIRRVLRETDPCPPSVAAASRAIDGGTRRPRAGGSQRIDEELDWIVLTAIAKEPGQRYSSASEFAADVRRYLRGEPVSAGPSDRAYRLRKAIQRNRLAVAAGMITVLGLLIGFLFAMSAWFEAEHQRNDADRLRQDETVLRAHAESEKETAEAVTRFLTETLSLADPGVSLDPHMSAQALLERVASRLDGAFGNDPRAEAALRRTIGTALQSLGVPDAAEPHLHRALELYENDPGAPPEEVYATIRSLWQVHLDLDSREASISCRASLLACRCIGAVDPILAASLKPLDPWGLDALETSAPDPLKAVRDRLTTACVPNATRAMTADVLFEVGRFATQTLGNPHGIPLLELALTIRQSDLPADHPDIGHASYRLALALLAEGRLDDAERHLRDSQRIFERSLPASHWINAAVRSALGECFSRRGLAQQAEELLISSHRRITESRGPSSEVGLLSTSRLLAHYRTTGRAADADVLRRTFAASLVRSRNAPWHWSARAPAFGADHEPLVALMNRVEQLMNEHDSTDMGPLCDAVQTSRRSLIASDDPLDAVIAAQMVDWSHALRGRLSAEARIRICDDAFRTLETWASENPVMVGHAQLALARAELDNHDARASVRDAAAAIERFTSELGRHSHEALDAQVAFATALVADGRVDESRDRTTQLLRDLRLLYGDDYYLTRRAEKLLRSLPS